ncbi:MAG: hypothetical protein VB092_04955 [Oscillospiraceae bacterium]|nr:hypothetical protein [Oscillospiraceae bacterium]
MSEEKAAYKCGGCGGEVQYDVKAQKFLCVACRAEYIPETESAVVTEKDFNIQKLLVSSTELSDVKSAVCASCGSELFFPANETAARCPMCGAAQLRAGAGRALIRPDGIVPFRVDAQDAQSGFRKYISKRFFAPSALKSAFEEGRLAGWYMPFWTFDAAAHGTYTGEGGKSVKVMRDGKETFETQWFPVRGALGRSFDDVLVCAASESGKKMTENLRYDTAAVKPYSSQYLQGYLAEYRSIEASAAFETAKQTMELALEQDAKQDIRREYTSERGVRVSARFTDVTCKSLLLPLYRASYSYKGKLYDYIINGQTGDVAARYPKSALKILLTILLIAALIAGVVLLTKLR